MELQKYKHVWFLIDISEEDVTESKVTVLSSYCIVFFYKWTLNQQYHFIALVLLSWVQFSSNQKVCVVLCNGKWVSKYS